MSTTNDTQAPYGKPTERAPMLSDDRLWYRNNQGDFEQLEGHEVRKFYENLITSGELIVKNRERIRLAIGDRGIKCKSKTFVSEVDGWVAITDEEWDRLLSEGAQIVP